MHDAKLNLPPPFKREGKEEEGEEEDQNTRLVMGVELSANVPVSWRRVRVGRDLFRSDQISSNSNQTKPVRKEKRLNLTA